MTYQGAINYFKEYIIFCERGSMGLPSKEPYMLAMAALRKQVPKKILKRVELKDFNNTTFAIRGKCPKCGFENILTTGMEYCSCCGQKLEWED